MTKQALALAPVPERVRLDNLTLTRKEGFRAFADAPRRTRPDNLTSQEWKRLSTDAKSEYARLRRGWHANLGPLRTPQLLSIDEDLWDIVDSNDQDGHQAKGAVAVDAFPGLGKTTSVLSFAAQYHRREIAERGERTGDGHERWPVCRIGLTGNTGMKDFNRSILEYYSHPARNTGTTSQFGIRALDCVLSCETKVLIVDDLHFLKWRHTNGVEVSNHFKHVANEFPVTLVFVGVGLENRGLFSEGETYADAVLAQTGRRTTRLTMDPFQITTEEGRRAWRQLLLAIEDRVVLVNKHRGMIADDLSDYLFARSTGHIGSLMTLINRGCQRAVREGVERLDEKLLDRVKNDAASERARAELRAALDGGRLTSRPHQR